MVATISIACIVLGCIIFTIARSASAETLGNGRVLGAGVLMIVGGAIMGAFGTPSKGFPHGMPGAALLGFAVAAAGLVWFLMLVSESNKAGQEKRMLQFYAECKKNGVTSFDSEKNIQKATLIAEKLGIPATDLKTLFAEAEAVKNKQQRDKELAKLEEKKQREQASCAELTKYAKYTGRDKRIAMLAAEHSECLSSANALIGGVAALEKASMQKEHDVAINAGIASGIGGGAWGMATAMDTQQKNAEIRAQNEATRERFAPMREAAFDASGGYYDKAGKLAKEIDAAKIKLVAEEPAGECLKRLSFAGTKVTVSDTGTCTVETTASAEPFTIFEDVKAVVDGTVIAEIYDGGSLIGTAQLVLPKYGAGKNVKLKGMSLFCGNRGKQYDVKFSAQNLWAMEQ